MTRPDRYSHERMQRGRRWIGAVALALLTVTAGACTDANLEPIPAAETRRADELNVSGSLCTRSPEELDFPMRVLFVVDTSISMRLTDPADPQTGETGRERAVEATWKRLLARGGENIRVGIMRFSADAQPKTPVDRDGDSVAESYFTSEEKKLQSATRQLRATSRTTNYVTALNEAYFEIRTELQQAKKESLPRTTYSVIFLSDGIPDISSAAQRGSSRDQILGSVEQLRELADSYEVGDFSFHTAFLATGQSAFDEQAQKLLEEMAETGNGNFRSFPSGEELNFLFADLTSLRRAFTLKTFTALNLSAVMDRSQIPDPIPVAGGAEAGVSAAAGDARGSDAGISPDGAIAEPRLRRPSPHPMTWVDLNGNSSIECGEPMVDTDGDGLADLTEFRIGSNTKSTDTDDDGLSDALEWELRESGLNPTEPTKSKCYTPNRCKDSNGDGQCDCLRDSDDDGKCNCASDPLRECVAGTKRDCVDDDEDGWCDCPDPDGDGDCDYADTDGDGLHDCEEVFYGTAQRGNDTDADGLPDATEVRFDTNPAKRDGRENLDSDQTANEIEVLANTNPRCDDSTFRSRVAYQYDLSSRGLDGSKSCYDFELDNVTLVPTLKNEASRYPGNGWNRILLYAGEVAFDDPSSFATYRVACVMARYSPEGNYKEPPSGRVRLSEDDFVEVRDFQPNEDCIWP